MHKSPSTELIDRVLFFAEQIPAIYSGDGTYNIFVTDSKVLGITDEGRYHNFDHHGTKYLVQIDQLRDEYEKLQARVLSQNSNARSLIDLLYGPDSAVIFGGGPIDADLVIGLAYALFDLSKLPEETFTKLRMISFYCDHRRLPELVYSFGSKQIVDLETITIEESLELYSFARSRVYLIEALGASLDYKSDLRPVLKMVLDWIVYDSIESPKFEIPLEFVALLSKKEEQLCEDADEIVRGTHYKIIDNVITIDAKTIQSLENRKSGTEELGCDSYYLAIEKMTIQGELDLAKVCPFIIVEEIKYNQRYLSIRQIPFHPRIIEGDLSLVGATIDGKNIFTELNKLEESKQTISSKTRKWGGGNSAGGSIIGEGVGTLVKIEEVVDLVNRYFGGK